MHNLLIEGEKFSLQFNTNTGNIQELKLFDGKAMNQLFYMEMPVCSLTGMENIESSIIEENESVIKLKITMKSDTHRITTFFEIYMRGYVISSFKIDTIKDNDQKSILVGVPLKNKPVFENNYQIKHIDKSEERKYKRATSVLFSTDKRPVTNSVDFILESVNDGEKVIVNNEKGKFIGWEIYDNTIATKGGTYSNRWCLHFSGINNKPSKVRGQRIYHWYGYYPSLPQLDILEEMAEYGCSILILHMPSFKWIDGSEPLEESSMKILIKKAHEANIKMMFYIQPILISQNSPMHNKLKDSLNDNGKLCWNSLKDTQIVFYVPNTEYDCDELCLRSTDAYNYMKNSVIDCYKKYGFDGLYVDFAWPSIGVCTDQKHEHKTGLFNFYDYIRMMREFRETIGPDGIMIGHGGSLLVSSDYAEGFDACLTGEGQKDMLPDVIGVQTGTVPTLWTMHRRKEKQFRSKDAMTSIIREGITPHIGLGILGKSIRASLDPAHTPHYIALWQMWRAFPVHKATFYNYLTTDAVDLDNDEVTYSMYITPEKQILLIISNGGGPKAEASVSVEVNIKIDIGQLKLPSNMTCWRLKGNTYETFRISKEDNITNGEIRIPEIAINEFMGIILTPDEPPAELINLIEHIKGRYDRLPQIYKDKMQRLIKTDKMIEEFNKLDVKTMDESEFMHGRTME